MIPDAHMLAVRAPADDNNADTSTAANNAAGNTKESLVDVIKTSGSAAMNLGTQATQSVEDVLKATGRTTIALAKMLNSIFGVASKTLSTGGEYVSNGVSIGNSFVSSVPIARTVTGGLSNLVSGITSSYSEAADYGRQVRTKMLENLSKQIDTPTMSASDNSATAQASTP